MSTNRIPDFNSTLEAAKFYETYYGTNIAGSPLSRDNMAFIQSIFHQEGKIFVTDPETGYISIKDDPNYKKDEQNGANYFSPYDATGYSGYYIPNTSLDSPVFAYPNLAYSPSYGTNYNFGNIFNNQGSNNGYNSYMPYNGNGANYNTMPYTGNEANYSTMPYQNNNPYYIDDPSNFNPYSGANNYSQYGNQTNNNYYGNTGKEITAEELLDLVEAGIYNSPEEALNVTLAAGCKVTDEEQAKLGIYSEKTEKKIAALMKTYGISRQEAISALGSSTQYTNETDNFDVKYNNLIQNGFEKQDALAYLAGLGYKIPDKYLEESKYTEEQEAKMDAVMDATGCTREEAEDTVIKKDMTDDAIKIMGDGISSISNPFAGIGTLIKIFDFNKKYGDRLNKNSETSSEGGFSSGKASF